MSLEFRPWCVITNFFKTNLPLVFNFAVSLTRIKTQFINLFGYSYSCGYKTFMLDYVELMCIGVVIDFLQSLKTHFD